MDDRFDKTNNADNINENIGMENEKKEAMQSGLWDKMNDGVEVPDSLKPGAIEDMLRRKQEAGEFENTKATVTPPVNSLESVPHKQRNSKILNFMKSTKGLVSVACLVVIIGGLAVFGVSMNQKRITDNPKNIEKNNIDTIGIKYATEGDNYKKAFDAINSFYKETEESFKTNGNVAISESANNAVNDTAVDGAAEGETTQSYSAEKNALASTDDSRSNEYSETNTRTEGVDEGDKVKTDGNYIYSYNQHKSEFTITKANDGELEVVSETGIMDDGIYVTDMYVRGDMLIFVGNYSNVETSEDGRKKKFYVIDYGYGYGYDTTAIVIYDISNRQEPKKIETFKQDGAYKSSRIADGVLYTFSEKNMYNYEKKPKFEEKETFIPKVNDKIVDEGCVIVHPYVKSQIYTVISSYKLEGEPKQVDTLAVLGGNASEYVSASNIYLVDYKIDYYDKKGNIIDKFYSIWDESVRSKTKTIIQRIAYKDGKFALEAEGECVGQILNDYSMDEYNGYLRLVSTETNYSTWVRTNQLYILNMRLEVVSSLKNIARKEEIKSARFMGDTGYFVTYLNTDPLFSVDLSDPMNPKLIGQLKIPGFSAYLHPFGDGLLLGIGYDSDENGGPTTGIKLSMFDVSDPTNVKEINKCVDRNYTFAHFLSENMNGVLIDQEKNLIGFSASGNSSADYLLYSYTKEDGFKLRLKYVGNSYEQDEYYVDEPYYIDEDAIEDEMNEGVKSDEEKIDNSAKDDSNSAYDGVRVYSAKENKALTYEYIFESSRGLYINDYLYVVKPGVDMVSFDLENLNMKDRI